MIFTDEQQTWLRSMLTFLERTDWWMGTIDEAFAHADEEMEKRKVEQPKEETVSVGTGKVGAGVPNVGGERES